MTDNDTRAAVRMTDQQMRLRIEELEQTLQEIAELATPPDIPRPGVKLDAIYDKARAALAQK